MKTRPKRLCRMLWLCIGTLVWLPWISAPLRAQENCDPARVEEVISASVDLVSAEANSSTIHQAILALLMHAQECEWLPETAQIASYVDYVLQHVTVQELLATRRVGVDVAAVVEQLATIRGDPLRGLTLYNGDEATFSGAHLTCMTCHNGIIGPPTEGSFTRVIEERLPNLPGYSVVQYWVESLLLPEEYITPGYSNALMPPNLGDLLDIQDLADLIAYMESQDQELAEE